MEIDRAVAADREVANVELRQRERAGRPCGAAVLPDEQAVIEHVEQPDRAVRRHIEQHRPLGSVQAAARAALVESDLGGAGVGDDRVRRP